MKSRNRQWLVEEPVRTGLRCARLATIAVVPILAACSDTTGPSRLVSITPASQTVVMEPLPNGNVLRTSVTLTNTWTRPVAWSSCGAALEKKTPDFSALDGPGPGWTEVWTAACVTLAAAAGSDFILTLPLQPGRSVTIPIFARVAPSIYPDFDGSPGIYRVRLFLATPILGNEYRNIPHDLSVSDPFTLLAQ
jgi:hypothetical protein